MTKDTYLRTVRAVLSSDPNIRIQASDESKLSGLGRVVERGERTPVDTIGDIEDLFAPFVGRTLRQALERALR